jgi:hypothetical protein
MMKSMRIAPFLFVAVALLWVVAGWSSVASGQDSGYKVHVDLTKDFYQTLRNEGSAGTKAYSNDPSVEYLREISIATRFMVETNLQILKNQEMIIQLLQFGPEKKKK